MKAYLYILTLNALLTAAEAQAARCENELDWGIDPQTQILETVNGLNMRSNSRTKVMVLMKRLSCEEKLGLMRSLQGRVQVLISEQYRSAAPPGNRVRPNRSLWVTPVNANQYHAQVSDAVLGGVLWKAKIQGFEEIQILDVPEGPIEAVGVDRSWVYLNVGRDFGLRVNDRLISEDGAVKGHIVGFYGAKHPIQEGQGAILFVRKGRGKIGERYRFDPQVFPGRVE